MLYNFIYINSNYWQNVSAVLEVRIVVILGDSSVDERAKKVLVLFVLPLYLSTSYTDMVKVHSKVHL